MRVSYLWLKNLVDFSLSPKELAELLTMDGLEVESLEPVGPELEGVYVGEVLEVHPHPNADKLTLCKVNLGEKVVEVVCGAPNVAVGQKIAYVGAGTTLPDGTLIESRSIRGVPSEGMICSELELGLGEDGSGIMVLDSGAQVGGALRDEIGPRDWAMDLEITINRPDCLCHVGVSREIAAALRIGFKLPEFSVSESGPPVSDLTSIAIEEPALCPRYSARVIRGVKIGPSPNWLRWRLEAVGLRAINNVVDVTNYVMLEMGHPMHAFDFNLLEGRKIVVRRARAGETFITLDEVERSLDDRMLLICDAKQGVAIAGVMGGLNSEIRDDTEDLLLESAYFDPINTRRTSKLLGLSTDSSRRFERGTDPNATVRALDMAASLITQLAGGEVATGVADVYPRSIPQHQIELRPERVSAILGIEVPVDEMREHLERLGCAVEDGEPWRVSVPTFRPDLEREIDLIEDIARLHGYNQVPSADRAGVSLDVSEVTEETFQEKLRDALVKLGFNQVTTSPLISASEATLPGYPTAVKLINPASEDMAYLRNGLLPSLLKVASHNVNRGICDLRIFEIGKVFCSEGEGQSEWDVVGGVITGIAEPGYWDREKDAVDFLDLKGLVMGLLREISLDKSDFFYYNRIDTAERFTADVVQVRSGEGEIGLFGQIHPHVVSSFDMDVPVFGFEFGVADLMAVSPERLTYKPFPKFPPAQRDLAFTLADNIAAGEVVECITRHGSEYLVGCDLFDVYHGPQVGKGNKSLAFRLNFQSPDRTLTDEEVDKYIVTIIREVERVFGAKLRS